MGDSLRLKMKSKKVKADISELIRIVRTHFKDLSLEISPQVGWFLIDNFIYPELRRRSLPKEELWAAQVFIEPPDKVEIFLNDEVKVRAIELIDGKIHDYGILSTREEIEDLFNRTFSGDISLEPPSLYEQRFHFFLLFERTPEKISIRFTVPNFSPLLKYLFETPQIGRVCAYCGKVFFPSKYHKSRQRFCSPSCRVRCARKRKKLTLD